MKTFAGIPPEYASQEKAAVWLQPIEYDGTSTWGKGADRGIVAFLEAAENMELYDIETKSEVYKKGISLLPTLADFSSPDDLFHQTYANTQQLLKHHKFLTFFGGEHSVSIGVIKAFYEHYDDLTVVQLDAHADLRPTYEGSPYNHACALHDASQHTNLIQVGIRSMDISEREYLPTDQTYWMNDISGEKDWMETSLTQMTDQVYITLDLDVLDPSIMPATGTPEPGGMMWYELLAYLKMIFEQKEVLGFDIVELAPIEGLRHPQYLAAKLYYKMLSYKFFQ